MVERPGTSRRQVLKAGLAAAAALALPSGLALAANIVDPYSGGIPLAFPLRRGTFQSLRDNWHASRIGAISQWSHRQSKGKRAHDGVDVLPSGALPPVYAPFRGVVSAVCLYNANGTIDYRASSSAPPPWDYHNCFDSRVPRFGNFIWLKSTAGDGSDGYYVFYCHLKDESALRGLLALGSVDTSAQVGVMGDSGNAEGTPQLHVEIHYPLGSRFTCTRCRPRASDLTAINPYASLKAASVLG